MRLIAIQSGMQVTRCMGFGRKTKCLIPNIAERATATHRVRKLAGGHGFLAHRDPPGINGRSMGAVQGSLPQNTSRQLRKPLI